MRKTEENSCCHWNIQIEFHFRKYRTQSVFNWERKDLSAFLKRFSFFFRFFKLQRQNSQQLLVCIFDFPRRQSLHNFHQTLMRHGIIFLFDMTDSDVKLDLMIIEGKVRKGQPIELVVKFLFIWSQTLTRFLMLLKYFKRSDEI